MCGFEFRLHLADWLAGCLPGFDSTLLYSREIDASVLKCCAHLVSSHRVIVYVSQSVSQSVRRFDGPDR